MHLCRKSGPILMYAAVYAVNCEKPFVRAYKPAAAGIAQGKEFTAVDTCSVTKGDA